MEQLLLNHPDCLGTFQLSLTFLGKGVGLAAVGVSARQNVSKALVRFGFLLLLRPEGCDGMETAWVAFT